MPENNNTDAYKMSLMFEDHLNHIYDSVTGYHSELRQDKDDPSKFNLYRWKDQNIKSLCNEAGGDYLVGELRTMVFNKHTIMGDLKQDEIATITAHCSAPFKMLVFYSKKYGVEEKALMLSAGLDVDTGVYTFLTSVRDGGMREFGKQILTVTVVQRPLGETPPPAKGLLG
jgi:hypothetical protein